MMNKGPEWKDEMDLIYYDCIYHSIRNGEEFLDDARLLADEGRYGHSVSISVLGQEELMKSWIILVSLINRRPITRGHEVFRWHKNKQVMIPILMFSTYVTKELEDIPEDIVQNLFDAMEESKDLQEFISINDEEWTLETFGELFRIFIKIVEKSGFFEYMTEKIFSKEKMIERGKILETQLNRILDELAMENLKQQGFYVDISYDWYSTPFMITKEQAEEQISQFEQLLDLIYDALGDYSNIGSLPEEKSRTLEFFRYLNEEFGAFGAEPTTQPSLHS
jgi:AbiV family abortive infection protein